MDIALRAHFAETPYIPSIQLTNALPSSLCGPLAPIALEGSLALSLVDASAAVSLELSVAPSAGMPVALPASSAGAAIAVGAGVTVSASVLCASLLVVGAADRVSVYDCDGGGSLQLLATLPISATVRALAAAAVCLPDAGGGVGPDARRAHPGGAPGRGCAPNALLIAIGGVGGAQLLLWTMPPNIAARVKVRVAAAVARSDSGKANGGTTTANAASSVPHVFGSSGGGGFFGGEKRGGGVLAPPTFSTSATSDVLSMACRATPSLPISGDRGAVAGVDRAPYPPLHMLRGFPIVHVSIAGGGSAVAIAASDGHVGLWCVTRFRPRLRSVRGFPPPSPIHTSHS